MIRWEQDEENDRYYYGYVGKKILLRMAHLVGYWYVSFLGEEYEYTLLKSAKRGAERMFKKFLKDAGLKVKP